jgi:hypothetical protein
MRQEVFVMQPAQRLYGVAQDESTQNAPKRRRDDEYPYQVVLPRHGAEESAIQLFLFRWVRKFVMYIEDKDSAFVRYCFEDPLDAAVFRSRFEPKAERIRLVR